MLARPLIKMDWQWQNAITSPLPTSMNLAECYRLLGLRSGASLDEIKASYRRLARRYHPDVNPGDNHARERFIAVTEAYKSLLASRVQPDLPEKVTKQIKITKKEARSSSEQKLDETGTGVQTPKRKPPSVQFNPDLSPLEQQLKANSYQQLQNLLREQRFPRAIALIEGLARRIPHDSEVTQWQAIVYQRWGRHLIQERQLDKARIYLKKALRTDPHNRSLWAEVEKDFRYMEQLY